MTIAICLKVGDGVVLGTDSASSLIGENNEYYNVYNTAEKTINLVKGLPVGMMTYGLGGMAGLSIGSLARDLRERLGSHAADYSDWALDANSYTVEGVAGRVKAFFYDELYRDMFGAPEPDTADPSEPMEPPPEPAAGESAERFPTLGFVVAGFSAKSYYAEVWTIEIDQKGRCEGPTLRSSPHDSGVIEFWGMPEALNRLVYGWSDEAHHRLTAAGLSPEVATQILVSRTDLAHPGMPMQDAIDLVRYLADVTVGYVRFKSGAPSVAPPIDMAAITRHQGFKWVARKHYYLMELNPPSDL